MSRGNISQKLTIPTKYFRTLLHSQRFVINPKQCLLQLVLPGVTVELLSHRVTLCKAGRACSRHFWFICTQMRWLLCTLWCEEVLDAVGLSLSLSLFPPSSPSLPPFFPPSHPLPSPLPLPTSLFFFPPPSVASWILTYKYVIINFSLQHNSLVSEFHSLIFLNLNLKAQGSLGDHWVF